MSKVNVLDWIISYGNVVMIFISVGYIIYYDFCWTLDKSFNQTKNVLI